MSMGVLPACVFMLHVNAWCLLQRPEDTLESLKQDYNYELLLGYWKLNHVL